MTTVHATIPRSSNISCNVTASHTRVAKKLMDKAGKEGKPWISGLFDYRVTPQSGSIASPLQLMTQHTPREKNLPQLPSTLGASEMHQTHQELIKRQGSNSIPERKYQELLQGTPVLVQHRQNATWEPATVVNQCAPNSYWIMQQNGAEQPKVYRCTRTMLKIRSTPTYSKQKAQMREWSTETQNIKSHIPAIPYWNRDCANENSQRHAASNNVQPPLLTLDLPESDFQKTGRKTRLQNYCVQMVLHWKMHLMHHIHHMHQGHTSQHVRTLESQPRSIVINFTCINTITPGLVDCHLKMLNFELYTYFVVLEPVYSKSGTAVQKFQQNMPNFLIFHVTAIVIDYC